MNIPAILKELAKVGVVALTEKSAETFVETKIKPIFENWGKEESRSIELEECLSEYLLRCYGKNNIMTTIVFGRLQKTLEDLYIPLTLEEYRSEHKKWIIDENCYDILDKYSRILIIDMAGMGKSTIVKYFACQGVNLDKYIPIVIELRRLEKSQSVLEYIQMQINSIDKNIKIEEIINILKKGDFVIFFDGYDEVSNENKSDVLDSIQEFTNKATNTKMIITSREDDDLNSLGEYKCVNIKPLTEKDAYKLIKKYDNDGEISKKLIRRLKEDTSMNVLKEFLENPLLVSLLYKTFEYKEEIPYKKIDFYEQVYVALFNDHDKTKGGAYVHEKKTKLDRYQFEQILRAFGFLSLKMDKVEYSNQLICQLLEQSIKRFGWLKISVEDFLYDITHAVPFIQKEGNEYKWVHKSFMEYFASSFICYDNKECEKGYFQKIVISNNDTKFYNVLDFCYDMDTLSFRKYVILPYLEKYLEKYEKAFTDDYFKMYEKEKIHLAKQIVSIADDIRITIYDMTSNTSKKGYEEYISDCLKNGKYKMMNICVCEDKDQAIVAQYKYMNPVINQIITNKLPGLFERVVTKQKKHYISKGNIELSFNDDISNSINKDKELFSAILEILITMIFINIKEKEYCELNLRRCIKMIKEIKEEQEFQCNNFFEL